MEHLGRPGDETNARGRKRFRRSAAAFARDAKGRVRSRRRVHRRHRRRHRLGEIRRADAEDAVVRAEDAVVPVVRASRHLPFPVRLSRRGGCALDRDVRVVAVPRDDARDGGALCALGDFEEREEEVMPSETPPLLRGSRLRVESPGAVRARRGIVRLARAEESTHCRELRGAERAVAGPDPRRSRRRRRASRIGTPLGRLGVPIAVAALDVWRLARTVRWTHTSRATRCGDGVVVTPVVAVAGSHSGGRRPRRDVIRWEKRVVGG